MPPQEGVKSHSNSSFSVDLFIYLFIYIFNYLFKKGSHSVTQGGLELITIGWQVVFKLDSTMVKTPAASIPILFLLIIHKLTKGGANTVLPAEIQ